MDVNDMGDGRIALTGTKDELDAATLWARAMLHMGVGPEQGEERFRAGTGCAPRLPGTRRHRTRVLIPTPHRPGPRPPRAAGAVLFVGPRGYPSTAALRGPTSPPTEKSVEPMTKTTGVPRHPMTGALKPRGKPKR